MSGLTSIHRGDLHVTGALSSTRLRLPAGSVDDQAVTGDPPGIGADKIIHRIPLARQLAAPATAVAAVTELVYICQAIGGATIRRIEAAVVTPATGNDRTVTVDLQRSTGGGAFASVLTAPIAFDDESDALTAVAGAIAADTLDEGDLLQIVVGVAGSDADQAKGLLVSVLVDEAPL